MNEAALFFYFFLIKSPFSTPIKLEEIGLIT